MNQSTGKKIRDAVASHGLNTTGTARLVRRAHQPIRATGGLR
jgi:hypothetical protein